MLAKKSFGQNFLKNKTVINKMITVADLQPEDIVLEIGPGKGALTKILLQQKIKKVIALEKDERIINFLKTTDFYSSPLLELISGDALKIDYKKLGLQNQKFIIVANLPFYITGKFLSQILSNKIQPKKIILILQKEVIDRIVDIKKSSILSISVQIFGDVKKIINIAKTNFKPQPKIDSALLLISNINKNYFTKSITEKDFFEFIKLAFSQKRKKLLKNLSQKYPQKKLEKIFLILNLNTNIRAEKLSLTDFKDFFNLLKNSK